MGPMLHPSLLASFASDHAAVDQREMHPENPMTCPFVEIVVRPGRFERPTPALGEWPERHHAIDGDRTK